MKRIAVMVCTVLGLALSTGTCHASWGHLFYSGYQPWWNIFAKRYKCLTPEEERLQKFWHDYYDAMTCFYKSLDAIDWVAYYKNHGYQINCGPGGMCGAGCGGRINYAPVHVTPVLQWAVPHGPASSPPMGSPLGGHGPGMMGGMPMAGMPMFGPMGMAGGFPTMPVGFQPVPGAAPPTGNPGPVPGPVPGIPSQATPPGGN